MSTTCERARALLGARHDGELDTVRTLAVDRHVAACAACSAELAALRRVSRAAAALREELPPADLAARVRAAAERERMRSEGAPWAWRVAAAAAIVLVSATAYAIGLWQGRTGTADAPARLVVDERPGGEREVGVIPAADRRDGGPVDDGPVDGEPVNGELVNAGPLEQQQRDTHPGEQQSVAAGAAPLPSDEEAVRAARSLFADLALVDQVPERVRAPLLEAQLAHFGLDRWARARDDAGPLGEVASLVRRLDEAVDQGAPAAELAVLRDSAGRPGLWRVPPVQATAEPSSEAPDVERLVDEVAAGLDGETRRSIGRWITAKDAWVRRGDDLDPLVQMVDALGMQLGGEAGVGRAFVLPDLAELESELEWTVEPDGSRRGVLHRESGGPGKSGVLHIEVHTSGLRTGGG
jgi:hypothetical protein